MMTAAGVETICKRIDLRLYIIIQQGKLQNHITQDKGPTQQASLEYAARVARQQICWEPWIIC